MKKTKYKIVFNSLKETNVLANGFSEAIIRGLYYEMEQGANTGIKLVTNLDEKTSMKNVRLNYSPNL